MKNYKYTQNPPESCQSLWYYPEINRFTDEDGYILHDLYQYFDIWQLEKWKKTKNYGILMDKNGDFWELFYPHTCEHECESCKSKCEVYGLWKDFNTECFERSINYEYEY